MLIEMLNGNWQMQMFCGIRLLKAEQIRDKNIASRWRSYLGEKLDIDKLQISCVQHWKPYMQNTHSGFCDVTVYESYITYPTDAKLMESYQRCTSYDQRHQKEIKAQGKSHQA